MALTLEAQHRIAAGRFEAKGKLENLLHSYRQDFPRGLQGHISAADSQRAWFPEMTERLRSQWHQGGPEPADSRAQGRHIGAK